MMLKFYVKYDTGATFTYVHNVNNKVLLAYLFNQFRRDPSVVRVLTEVNHGIVNAE